MWADLVTVGELLIDLTQTGVSDQGVLQFAANPGGAPANVAVAAAKLGAKTAFVGCVGQDGFGQTLRATLQQYGVATTGLFETDEAPTTLAVVTVAQGGERSFAFYRDPGADVCLAPEMIPAALLQASKVVHVGSVSLSAEPCGEATRFAVQQAKALGKCVSYDPNYRAALWPDSATAVSQMRSLLPFVDVIKISDEETALLTDDPTPEGAAKILSQMGISLVLVTLGAKGVYYRFGDLCGVVDGCKTKVADTNGAGDTFLGAFLSKLLCLPNLLGDLTPDLLQDYLSFANRAAAITVSRPGAIPAMPTRQELA